MRQVLSWRFVAALAALVGLALLVNALFVGQDTVARVVERSGPTSRRADVVAIVVDSEAKEFGIRRNGFSRGRIDLRTHEDRSVTIFPGTPGASTCDVLSKSARSRCSPRLGDAICGSPSCR